MIKAFHGKGLWYYGDFNKSQLPSATIIGSSNFGHRSVFRDLEANLLIYTKNNKLQKQTKKLNFDSYSKTKEAEEIIFKSNLINLICLI